MRSIKTQSFILAVIFLCALIFACIPAVSVYAEGDTPEDPTPEDPTPEDPTPEDPTPEDPTPEDPIPEDPTPEDPTPEDPTPEDPTPEDPTPEPTPSSNAKLSMIYIDGKPISGFSPDKEAFKVYVPGSKSSIKITATPQDPAAEVIGTGTKSISEGTHYRLDVCTPDETYRGYTIIVHILNITVGCSPWGEWGFTYDYSGGNIIVSSPFTGRVEVSQSIKDINYSFTINGGSIPSGMGRELNDLGSSIDDIFGYTDYSPKTINLGTNINKTATFPKISIKASASAGGITVSGSSTANAVTVPSPYDVYMNNSGKYTLTSNFCNYMNERLSNSSDDNSQTEGTNSTSNTDASPTATPQPIPSPTPAQTVDTLANDDARGDFTTETDEQNNTVNVRLSFKDRFENNDQLQTVDVWYREKPNQTAFRVSDLFVTTAYAANDDWEHIVLDNDNADISLTLDTDLKYDLICVANLADGKKEDIYYEIFPKADSMVVEANIDKLDLNTLPYERVTDKEPGTNDKDDNRSTSAGMSTPMLIIIISGILLISSSTGLIIYTRNEKKRARTY